MQGQRALGFRLAWALSQAGSGAPLSSPSPNSRPHTEDSWCVHVYVHVHVCACVCMCLHVHVCQLGVSWGFPLPSSVAITPFPPLGPPSSLAFIGFSLLFLRCTTQPGDALLSVNGRSLEDGDLQDVKRLIQRQTSKILLRVRAREEEDGEEGRASDTHADAHAERERERQTEREREREREIN